MRRFTRFMGLTTFTALLVYAQDISGDWQGTLKAGAQEIRIILQIAKGTSTGWTAKMLSIDQSQDRGAGAPATSFSLDGSNIKFAIGQAQASYTGTLSADGTSISGTWMQRQAALAIYALPHATGQPYKDDAARAAAEARDEATTGAQAKSFENGVPSARVVRLPHANHYVFFSNEADVLREMSAFLGSLPLKD